MTIKNNHTYTKNIYTENIKIIVTSGPPVIVKYKPFTGWFAKAIGSTGPIKLDMTTLEFLNVP
jgi:hypothetical protein